MSTIALNGTPDLFIIFWILLPINVLVITFARPNSQARTGTGEYLFPCSADHEQDRQPYPVDPYPVDPYPCYL